jgi:hypothetical protein
MKWWVVAPASTAVLVALGASYLIFVDCKPGQVTECNYRKIKAGMTVSEAERFLGPSEQRPADFVPKALWPDGAIVRVVSGDRLFTWRDEATGREVWVGVSDGKIRSHWYWQPSL